MLARTYVAILLFFVLFFITYVESQFIFLIVVFLTGAPLVFYATTKFEKSEKKKVPGFISEHKEVVNSFTLPFIMGLIFAFFFPVLAFPFFMTYTLYLVAESFTLKGIKPFYPHQKQLSGKIRPGGKLDGTVFTAFILADLFLLILRLSTAFG